MKKLEKNTQAQVTEQVRRMRRLYSEIGEPLPAELLIDLHLHLGEALEAGGHAKSTGNSRRKADA